MPCSTRENTCCHYGWVVVLAAAVIRILVYGIAYTPGVVYIVILENFDTDRGETAWITSIITATTFIVSPFSGVLLNRFGWRVVAFSGGVICCVGLGVASLSPSSLLVLYLTYGVLTGIGCGLAYMPGSVAVPKYFRDYMNLAQGLAAAGGGLGSFLFPPIINALNDYYGWRGMFVILAGISLNMCVFGLLYRPLPIEDENRNSVRPSRVRRQSSTVVKNDWSFLRVWQFYVILANNFLYSFGASVVYGHLGAYAHYHCHFDRADSASLYSIIGISGTFCKITQGFTADLQHRCRIFEPIIQYIIFYAVGGVATLFLPWITSSLALVVYSLFFGASYAACGGSLIPAMLIELKGKDQLGLTYGVTLAVMSTGYIIGAPIAGWMYDQLHSYLGPFVLAAVVMTVSAVIMWLPRRFRVTQTNLEITICEGTTVISSMNNDENTQQETEMKQAEMEPLQRRELSSKSGSLLSLSRVPRKEDTHSLLDEEASC